MVPIESRSMRVVMVGVSELSEVARYVQAAPRRIKGSFYV